jgi:hypothetical protein
MFYIFLHPFNLKIRLKRAQITLQNYGFFDKSAKKKLAK